MTPETAQTPPGTARRPEEERERAVEAALAALDLDAKTRLLAGQDMWTLPALGEIALGSLVMSDGPVGVRGRHWTDVDPSVALPSPTALAATWDPVLARRAGRLLAQEAHRKGVHVLLAPTVNLHRSPLGGRHFEAYSEDPYLTGAIGTGYVLGVQDGGVGVTVKHFVGNDAETDRFTVDNRIPERALRELYLAPFEAIVADARPWGVMAAYNAVNGATMTEHAALVNGVLRGEWGFDGVVVSDWFAARGTAAALRGGLDLAMPGPVTVYGPALAAAVRAGEVEETLVDAAVRRVLRLAARAGLLAGTPAAVAVADRPPGVDGEALAREIAATACVLLRNEVRGQAPVLPLDPAAPVAGEPGAGTAAGEPRGVALIGTAARHARILGGGSAQVFPDHVVTPLDGLRAALPPEIPLTWAAGADPNEELAAAGTGFTLRAVARDAAGRELGGEPLASGQVLWLGDLPEGVAHEDVHTVEVCGAFVPSTGGAHRFGTRGLGGFRLTVGGTVLFDGLQADENSDPFEAFFGVPTERGTVDLTEGRAVEVSLVHTLPGDLGLPVAAVGFALLHGEPERDPEELLDEAVAAARAAHTAVVVVATTERVESEGFDRTSLRLPGRQDDLVARVAAVNPRTVVVVNAGAPVEMPWREEVAAVLLAWFPGQEGGAALADVLFGVREPGGRLPTTWPARLADAPVSRVTPEDGRLVYDEGLFIGYRAWDRGTAEPAYPFGHGLGYTDWAYESLVVEPAPGRDDTLAAVRVELRNTGARHGREVVQLYLRPAEPGPLERPRRRLAGFAVVEAAPGETVEARMALPVRAAQCWDPERSGWRLLPGGYAVDAAHSLADVRLSASLTVEG
ncbi:beta-glucosidase family protein [Actinacidiphila acidipaludis]|uniref:Glycoside hydrolase family 3 C-terminal domain-containing protein n=1 Tax=Actinacidiphila acidipaludis TaxID=2873382 RepID=A0ABS7Q488_9ACTN|nr:glycoside hydrolase family 3 C-terminal domain-containing protein [Streptomyces acidipaludis]MBY8877773.1 glycoside hydrolase family 3 C-terminal domain-containing protein [Streptomyces acidipaludis]